MEPTYRQKKAAQALLENGGTIADAMREAKYSAASIKNPHKLTRSDGWKKLMEAYLPDETIFRALADDIENKPGKRVQELKLASEIKGLTRPEERGDTQVQINVMNFYGGDTPPQLPA